MPEKSNRWACPKLRSVDSCGEESGMASYRGLVSVKKSVVEWELVTKPCAFISARLVYVHRRLHVVHLVHEGRQRSHLAFAVVHSEQVFFRVATAALVDLGRGSGVTDASGASPCAVYVS